MEKRRPEIIFSTLTGVVMLIFMIGTLTDRSLFDLQIQPFGIPLVLQVTSMQLLIPMAALIVGLGMYWALQMSLPVTGDQIRLHLFLPFAVTLAIGFTLDGIDGGVTGLGLLFLTAVLLYLVLYFEYTACDPASVRRPVSVIVLDGLCYAVFLLFVIALRAGGTSLFLSVPAVFILCFIISLKIYAFHIINTDTMLLAGITAAVMVFADAGLHFWPVNIVSYASLMFVWYYAFINLVIGKDHEETFRHLFRRILPAGIFALIVLIVSVV